MIRNLNNDDIGKSADLWNDFLPHEPVTREMIIRKLFLDVNFDRKGFFVYEENGKILGFCNGVFHCVPMTKGAPSEFNMGYINAFAVKRCGSFDKICNELLNSAENYLKENNKTEISTAYYPVYFTQGVNIDYAKDYADVYEKRGYKFEKSCSLYNNLAEFLPDKKYDERKQKLIEEGFYIGELKDEYLLSAIDPNEPFSNFSWSVEFKSRIVNKLDYETIRIAVIDNHVIGACAFGDPIGSPERFGPFGVNSELRGKGIGSVLLNDCLKTMKKRNLRCAWMQWVEEGSVAYKLYQKFGFTKTNTYHTYTKEL